jgi:hypothetical protein
LIVLGQFNGLGATASASFTLGGGTSSRTSAKRGSSAADKSMKAELTKKAQAEAAGAVASDIGSRFFAGETKQYVPAREAIKKTVALYNQAIALANAGGVTLITGFGAGVTAAQRATDYQDRIEELDVAAQAMVPEFAKQIKLKVVPKKTPTERKFLALNLFGKSMGLRSAQLEPEPQESSLTTWLIVGAVVLAAGGGYYYYTTKKSA